MCQKAPYILFQMSHLNHVFTRKSFISMLKSEFLDEGQTVVIIS